MTITKITIPCTDDTMGDTSPSDCNAYREWFAEQLQAEYPDAEIEVIDRDGSIEVETDDGADDQPLIEELHAFSNYCWDRCKWDFLDD
jgi:hypothetical protein